MAEAPETSRNSLGLHWQILIGMALGLAIGSSLFYSDASVTGSASELGHFGSELFLRALQMLVVPLILASLVSGVLSVAGGPKLRRTSGWIFGYYLFTSCVAVCLGLLVVNLIGPGHGLDFDELFSNAQSATTKPLPVPGETGWGAVAGVLERAIPTNIFDAAGQNRLILSVIVFSLLFGIFIRQVEEHHRQTMTSFFDSLFAVMMKMTTFVVSLAPYGVFFAMLALGADGKIAAFGALAKYMGTVLVGLSLHAFVVLPLLLVLVARVSPWQYARTMAPALLTAFSTASSNATLPLTMKCAGEAGVSKETTSFALPLGATVNMDGTALYEVVAVMFVAQMVGDLSVGEQFVVAFTALAASIGAAGIPHAGLVMMITVFQAVGMGDRALAAVTIIIAVDRILDMARTTVNVWSDSTAAAVVDTRVNGSLASRANSES